jgi:exonuclease SbcC
MRPRELRLKGFRSYRSEQTFSFVGRRLVGIVGPIGSGKSSILDAIAFALYGKTPTFKRNTKSLINQHEDVAQVELTFEVDGELWRAQRAPRRSGASGHKLERLASDDPDASALEVIEGEGPTIDRVEQLLGMDFDTFQRSVLLAQNRFQEFLRATPKQRNDVLKGVFGHGWLDLAHQGAKRRVAVLNERLNGSEQEGSRLASAQEDLLGAQELAEHGAARARELSEASERVEMLRTQLTAAETQARQAQEEIERLAQVRKVLANAGELKPVIEASEEVSRRLTDAGETAKQAETSRQGAEEQMRAVQERIGDRLAALAELVATHERMAETAQEAASREAEAEAAVIEATASMTAQEAAAASADAAVEAAAQRLADLDRAAEAAERALHEARHADMARSLRRDLHEGEPCPVCEQQVSGLPSTGEAPELAAAQERCAKAREAQEQGRSDHNAACTTATQATERRSHARTEAARRATELDAAKQAAAAARERLAAIETDMHEQLGQGDPRALLAARTAEMEDAKRLQEEAAAAERAARAALEAVREDRERIAGQLTGLATTIAEAWGLLGESIDDAVIPSEPGTVRTSLVSLDERIKARRANADEALAAAAAASTEAREAYGTEVGALGLGPDDDLRAVTARAQADAGAAAQRVTDLESTIAQGADLQTRITETTHQRDIAARLVKDLQPSNFLAFLLEEERAALAEIGSEHLEDLSGGSYRFSDDDRFDISDLSAAGLARSADSLSGGETFLASLALALALADMVTRGGGRLDAFFLDEGFGSLDPEHIDRAMAGIERIVTGGGERLVVLVSHVAEMREAIDDLIVLDKEPLTGTTLVMAGAQGPG